MHLQGSRIFLKSYLPRASEDRQCTCPPKKFTFPIKVGRKFILNILFHLPNIKIVLIIFCQGIMPLLAETK